MLEFSRQIFEKFSNIKCHLNPYRGNGVVSCTDGQTGRHGEASSHISQSEIEPKNCTGLTLQ